MRPAINFELLGPRSAARSTISGSNPEGHPIPLHFPQGILRHAVMFEPPPELPEEEQVALLEAANG